MSLQRCLDFILKATGAVEGYLQGSESDSICRSVVSDSLQPLGL